MHDRLSDNKCRENKRVFKIFSSLKDVPGPKKVIAQMCSMEAVQQNDGFTLFST